MKKFGQFVNESDINFNSDFKTEVDDMSVYFIFDWLAKDKGWTKEQYDDFEYETQKGVVNWEVQPEMRNDCIKSMNLTITKVVCSVMWYMVGGEEEFINIDTTLPEWKDWQMVSSVDFDSSGGVCPSEIQLDFRAKKIFVE